jgi:hypothetical protein
VGIKDERRYHGLTNFEKCTASTMKARSVSSHPLVKENQVKVLKSSKRKRSQPTDEEEQAKPKACIKKENMKKEKEIKREYYVSINKKE